jgi:hypothetical protein
LFCASETKVLLHVACINLAAVVRRCYAVVELSVCPNPLTVVPAAPTAPVIVAVDGMELPSCPAILVTDAPTPLTELPSAVTTGATGLPPAGGAGAGEPVPPPVPPDPVGPPAGAPGDGAAVTVVPGDPLTARPELGATSDRDVALCGAVPFVLAKAACGVVAPGTAMPVDPPPEREPGPPRGCAVECCPRAAMSLDRG